MNTTTDSAPETLRARMVDTILAAGHAQTPAVEAVLRAVPRHRFVPEASLEDAYADIAVITKRADDGAALSCASVPTVVAMMLDQLDVHPGQRVLEIGAGTGYNAALLAELVGPDGAVTTIDIDDEVTAGARRGLDATGHEHVRVITRDGALGAPEHGPYDRIIITVGAWDLPPTWHDQLLPGGRLVVPLRWRGQTQAVAFIREQDRLRSDRMDLCGFVPMIGQDGEKNGTITTDGTVTLYYDIDQPIDTAALTGVLDQPRTSAWSGITIGTSEPFDGVWLTLTATDPATCRIAATQTAIDSGLCTPAISSRSPALAEDSSLAYFTYRRLNTPEPRFELGAHAHGPTGEQLAERLCTQIRAWNNNRGHHPQIHAHPANTQTVTPPTGQVITKRDSTLVLLP
ncbi:protein-L-isoaspartate(D-aspartate) O-methyltransferase [Actinokineospora diospyrosa]|uniref:Protein-L-isoaspartate O-methyltransferase n=4 Tax=Actinokineospora diospyrosa TaxID=103728 RepID=A0ABT1IP19_9PSEU|nr:protein-L-isoaspartate(D-aspartate) O-methyltransferase [Actinokineospora diospyrosa]